MKGHFNVCSICAQAVRTTVRCRASAGAWAPEGSATIHPGVMTFTNASSFLNGASQCTANFVFTDAAGNVYLKGYGDPTLSSAQLTVLARQVRAAGVTRITGAV